MQERKLQAVPGIAEKHQESDDIRDCDIPKYIAQMEAAGDPKAGLAADMYAECLSRKRKLRLKVRKLNRLLRKGHEWKYRKTAN
jgi:hypothetical protein